MNTDEFIQEYKTGRRDFRKVDLQNVQLSGVDISGSDLSEANLQGACFQASALRGVNFQGANLQGASFRGTYFYGVNLRGADLRRADLREIGIRKTDFSEANLEYADLRMGEVSGQRLNLRCADLRGKRLRDKTPGSSYRGFTYLGDIQGSDLSNAVIDEHTVFLNLTDAILTGTNLRPTNLKKNAVMPDGKRFGRSTDLTTFTGNPPRFSGSYPLTPKKEFRVIFALPALQTIQVLIWPPYCVCCGEPADRFTELSRTFDVSGGGLTGHVDVNLKLPYCTACLQHDVRKPEVPWIPNIFMLIVGFSAFYSGMALLMAILGAFPMSEAYPPLAIFIVSLLVIGGGLFLESKAEKKADRAIAVWRKPSCSVGPPVDLSEKTNVLGMGTRTYILSFANTDCATRFAEMNALRVMT